MKSVNILFGILIISIYLRKYILHGFLTEKEKERKNVTVHFPIIIVYHQSTSWSFDWK